MDYNEVLSMLEQYQSNGGGDINDFKSHLSILAANGKTPLGLNQWQRSDKPVMDDFNEDNRIIDAELRALREELSNKANVALPQIYDLKPIEGLISLHKPFFYKNSFGEVGVSFVFQKPVGVALPAETTIAVLPKGFSPPANIIVPGHNDSFESVHYAIHTNGNIIYRTRNTPQNQRIDIYMVTHFLAAQ